MTSEVAGLTESKFSATQAGPCSHTDVPIALTVALCRDYRASITVR